MSSLKSNFAGIKSPNPFWLASAPPTNSGYQVMRAFDKGWGGAVWKTLGVPIINTSSRYGAVNYRDKRMVGFNNIELISDRPLSDNLRDIEEVKKYFPEHAVIGSLMVETKQQWHQIIKDVENAGVDGIELNFGCPHGMCERGMGSAVGQEPNVLTQIVSWVMETAKVPVIVKLTPNVSHIEEPAIAAKRGGANAVSLINTIQSIVGVDIDNFVPYPVVDGKSTNGGYCGPAVKPIAMNMVKNVAKIPGYNLPISGIGGIENWRDAVEFILLGATNVQVCTAVMHYGFGIIREILAGFEQYMDEKNFSTVDEMIGKALPNILHWEELNLNYKVIAKIEESKCIGCQLCYIACEDGAHQAIGLPGNPDSRIPHIIEENCVGCNLCSIVCPVENCISMVRKDENKKIINWQERTAQGNIPVTFDDKLAGGVGHYIPEPKEAIAYRLK
ncbi:MAG: NAD-dependent dihydropyrimidine dehydrogenase subunit PreA [Ignavibacteriae bacterium]|jgi:dihydropyrimidine dehydrogenase (NAD+) subunit PreA|nr:NAD-dependent dihydropyrimidine dehydrogenase subunit PreA [Ignavibacteriota bacterium]